MKKIDGGVTAPKGFKAAGLYAGIKKGGKKDMAMVYSEVPCRAAGVFTTNVVKAAPVKWDHEVVYESEFAQAVVVNSGVAHEFGEYDSEGNLIRAFSYDCMMNGYRVMKGDFEGFWFREAS